MHTDLPPGADALDTIRSVGDFAQLPPQVLTELAAEMSMRQLADGETLVNQHETGATMCVVASGVLSVTRLDHAGVERTLADVPTRGIVGEISVVADVPAFATVRALGPATVVELSRAGLERFVTSCPTGALDLVDALRPRLHRNALRVALHETPAFRNLDAQLLADLEPELEPITLHSGEVLLREGEPGDSIFLVISGRLRVVRKKPEDEEIVLAELGPGETVGEMAFISGEPRTADVYAIRDTQLAKLSRHSVKRLLARHPMATLVMLAHGPVTRVRRMSSGATQVAPVVTIAIVPASPGVPLDQVGEQLCRGLARIGQTLHVTSRLVDESLGAAGAAQAFDRDGKGVRLIEWLAAREIQHRFVVYQSDPICTPWTERAIRQADHVVIVARATDDPSLGEIETELLERPSARSIRRTLLLVHEGAATPSHTMRWLTPRPAAERHLHARLDSQPDFDRIARMLTGNAIGLVLGGGFARGLSHVGVIRAFRELDIPIDVLGGSSMGAMVGAQHLLGWDGDRIMGEVAKAFEKSFDDMTIPFLSFKRGGKSSRIVQGFFGDHRIEDLWIPFFCTSSNLNRAELKVHTHGSMATALLATTRAPGIFPPVVLDGELHVDGGLINNVPVDVMKTFSNQGVVIGVDVSPPHQLDRVTDYGDDITGWQAIWHRFNPTREKRSYRPSLLIVLMRLIEFGGISYRVQAARYADVYISPDVLRFKRNEFAAARDMADVGYAASKAKLAGWLARGSTDVGGLE